ncbi:arabinan endo-1,5-alpha-L-arabinosidase [Belliella sp. DSM 111904]|uniref:Arabinan endo-1,5-alpha-L-arabinosidase n=1 Tax=Belliella filtrata TaxID=2923435 RepID=A0ABS9UVW0_9BACT|nr:arabinan endo-1,5-alpha-L-arabinosidase [Belliella filtrata]MCH7408276.1 arabinan endo-1,5-alpha-L-arabinosidase [Belliella filtrata]
MNKCLLSFVIAIMLLVASLRAYGQYRDSIQIPVHDPVMIQEKDSFYLFATGRGISVWKSSDMQTWTRQNPVFEQATDWMKKIVPDFKNHIWAPDISHHNGFYYLYYSISAFGKNTSAIGLAKNSTLDENSPDYEWEDLGMVIQSVPGRDNWNAIDPNLVIDREGVAWLSFGSFWDGVKMVRLADDLKTVQNGKDDWFTIARRKRTYELNDRSPGDGAIEAPFIFEKEGYYYLFVSFDYCCKGAESTYKIVVGRSDKVQGPYFDRNGEPMQNGGGSLVVEGDDKWYGVGHNAALTFEEKDYLIFHGYEAKDNGRSKLLIRQISWDQDGWPSVSLVQE